MARKAESLLTKQYHKGPIMLKIIHDRLASVDHEEKKMKRLIT